MRDALAFGPKSPQVSYPPGIAEGDDNFASIVAAIDEGRSIYANIQKFLRYLLSTNLGEVLVMFLGVAAAGLLGVIAGSGEALVLPLLVTMILRINLVTDSFPALAVGVDPADPELMHRAPRDPRGGVITPRDVVRDRDGGRGHVHRHAARARRRRACTGP